MYVSVILYSILISTNTHIQDGLLKSNIVNNILDFSVQKLQNVMRVSLELPNTNCGFMELFTTHKRALSGRYASLTTTSKLRHTSALLLVVTHR